MKISEALLGVLLLAFSCNQPAWSDGWDLQDRDGTHYRLSDLRGKWVLVNFWAPWCPSCIQEMPDLVALQKQHKDLQVIGVAVMYRKKQEVADIIHKEALTYPIVLGNEDTASEFGEIEGLPTSFLYSPTGKLLGHHEGPLSRQEVDNALQRNSAASNTFTR